MNVADQCREMKLKVGDTIFGREDTCGHWHEAKLTLLWLGKEIAIWSETTRSSRDTEWSKPCETGSWSLFWRDWKKVETDQERQEATENTAEQLRAIFKRDGNEKWFPEKNERFVAAILEVLSPEKQGIVRASIVAYNEGRAGNPYHPGYTDHEAMAWEIGQAEVEKVKRA